MYENQDKMLIKKPKKNNENKIKNYSKYYGKNIIIEGEMFEHIVFVSPIGTDRLKVKFISGENIILTEDDFLKYVII